MQELCKLVEEIIGFGIIKASFSVPYDKNGITLKCTLKKQGENFQFESFTKTQAFHQNCTPSELAKKICELLEISFRQCEIFTCEYVYGIKISSKGKLLHNRRKNVYIAPQNDTHNRQKNHLIDPKNAPEVLRDIGVITKDGAVANSKYDKFKQICRFLEFIDDVVRKDSREEYNIVDFGCGKSYLTFVCYHYMTKIAHKRVNIVGLDLKERVIEDCNNLAEKYGYDTLKFLCMDIKDYKPAVRPDMVIALHACDIATDYALYNAYLWQTDYIFSVPCCQHELNGKISTDNFSLLCDYGLIKERFSALATDALRAKMLEMCGYSVDVLEFIDIEHSPKNVLIRARRGTKITDKKRNALKKKTDAFTKEFNAQLSLQKLVFSHSESFDCDGETFTMLCGKSSMLVKDAMAIRSTVFGTEQNYKAGASRDKFDDTAWFCNVYDAFGNTVSTSRMIYLENKTERLIGKIAVLPKFRKYGLGKRMVEVLSDIAKEEKAVLLHINSQEHALGFYQKLGFEISGESYVEENIAMIPVRKKI